MYNFIEITWKFFIWVFSSNRLNFKILGKHSRIRNLCSLMETNFLNKMRYHKIISGVISSIFNSDKITV